MGASLNLKIKQKRPVRGLGKHPCVSLSQVEALSKGPRTQIMGFHLEPKYYSINGIWALKPYYLRPWTLKVLQLSQTDVAGTVAVSFDWRSLLSSIMLAPTYTDTKRAKPKHYPNLTPLKNLNRSPTLVQDFVLI